MSEGCEVAQIGERWGREGNQMATGDDLRDALRDERARVADLRKRVQDNKYLRFCLVSATGVLDIVEHAISPATMAEPRLASSPAWWLQETADLLGGARAQVNFVGPRGKVWRRREVLSILTSPSRALRARLGKRWRVSP